MDDQNIKQLFKESTESISLSQVQTQKLVSMRSDIKPMSPWQRFLDKEICIPMSAFSVTTAAVMVAGLLFFHSLLLPGDVPQPKYQIIEMSIASSQEFSNKA